MFRIHKSADRIADFKGDRVPKVSKYFALGRRRISNAPLFMQIAPASVGAVRKIISYVSFSAGPSLDTENTLLALGQDVFCHAPRCRHCILPFPPSPLFLFFSPFQELSNFLYISLEGNSSNTIRRFVSFRSFFSFLSRQWRGWKFSIAFLQFTEAAIRCEGFGDFQFAGGKGIRLDKVGQSFVNRKTLVH